MHGHDVEHAARGAYDDRVIRVAEGLGYQLVMWTISAADTSPNGTDRGIAKRALAVVGEQQPKKLMLGLKHMGELALEQLKEVLDAFIERDADRALRVWYKDEEIDAMYNSLFRELLTYMMEDPRNIGLCTHLLFGAKNIERIGDHATNIAETVYFLVHGTAITDQRPKGDNTSMTPVSLKRSAG